MDRQSPVIPEPRWKEMVGLRDIRNLSNIKGNISVTLRAMDLIWLLITDLLAMDSGYFPSLPPTRKFQKDAGF